MDTVFIRGFVSSRCKQALCTRRFPLLAEHSNPAKYEVLMVYLRVLSFIFCRLDPPASKAASEQSRLVDRPGITFVELCECLVLPAWNVLFITARHAGGRRCFRRRSCAGDRRQSERALASRAEGKEGVEGGKIKSN